MKKNSRVGLGIDVGGTFTKIFAVSDAKRVVAQAEIATEPERGPEDYVARLADAVRGMERGLGRKIDAACLGVAGDVDPRRGLLRRSPNLSRFEHFPLRSRLRARLGRPIQMHNDANMAAWGCYAVELGRRCPNVVALTMGTGIGGGIILGGRLYAGSTGSAGEIGHMRVQPGGELCGCGARGCLEAYAGAAGIVRTAERLLTEDPPPSSLRGRPSVIAKKCRLRMPLEGGQTLLDPRSIAEAARRGDALARETYARVGRALGVGIVNLIYLFNPDAVVIVGGVSRAGALFLGQIKEALRAESFRTPFSHVRVSIAKAAQLGSIGAALFSLDGEQAE